MVNFEKIRELATQRNLTIKELEAKVGFSNGTIGKWKTASPQVCNIAKVAQFFGVPIEELLT